MVRFRVGEILEEKGMSVSDLQKLTGLNYRTCLDVSRGSSSRIDLDTIDKVCWALNVTPAEIFEYERTKPEGVP